MDYHYGNYRTTRKPVSLYGTPKMIAWIGTIASILGAFLMAFGVVLPAFVCFTLGSVSWMIVGIRNGDKPLTVLNSFFLVANLIGLFRAII